MCRYLQSNILVLCLLLGVILFIGIAADEPGNQLIDHYKKNLVTLNSQWSVLVKDIEKGPELNDSVKLEFRERIHSLRKTLKGMDMMLRYYEPLLYKKLNAPLPVEWETEVFEKFEKPYKREGAGLILAELYLDEASADKDSLLRILRPALPVLQSYQNDSLLKVLLRPDQFLYANRLYLLNLATIYTSGFECPDPLQIVPELIFMLEQSKQWYEIYNSAFPNSVVTRDYLLQYDRMIDFVKNQPVDPERFDHFTFIRSHVNVLFGLNQGMLRTYRLPTRSFNDYSLSKDATSIFSKNLFMGQNRKGVFTGVNDPALLDEIKETGRLLFFDPLLSGNGKRSCAGCHKPDQCFTDTLVRTALAFDGQSRIERNAPSLVNLFHNHLMLQDGKHYLVEDQLRGVITNPVEMGCSEQQLVQNVLSCDQYKKNFRKYVKQTPAFPEVSTYHIVSAIMIYLSEYSDFEAPFDKVMNEQLVPAAGVKEGFNLFMSKAQCATCHFAPIFNGVKPPYVGSEFEVIGVPADTAHSKLSPDSGRYRINPAMETFRAFRTGTIRNAARTAPYMHNGVFNTLDEVLRFYNHGGGAGRGLDVPNQTLSSDSLHLNETELGYLKAFMFSLNEEVQILPQPSTLPETRLIQFQSRVVGGNY